MRIEYLDKIGFIKGIPQSGFLIDLMGNGINDIKKSGKRIILFGVGENSFFAEMLLEKKSIEIYRYADNLSRLQGKYLRGREILNPYDCFKREDIYFIITTQTQRISDVRLQFMAHNICNYGIFLRTDFHDFLDEEAELQELLMDAVNDICFEKEVTETVLPYGAWSIGRPGDCIWMLRSTQWSHWAYIWERELLKQQRKKVLEIGPGFGLMSLVLLKESPDIELDWVLLGKENGSIFSGKNSEFTSGLKKIKKWYGERVNEIWGEIEKNKFHLPEKKYDLIIMTEVFEHFVLKPLKVMKKLHDSLNDEGILILTTPNWGHVHIYEHWEDMPEDEDVSDERYEQMLKSEHVYQYEKEELEDIFVQCGFEIVEYKISDSNNHNYMLKKYKLENEFGKDNSLE